MPRPGHITLSQLCSHDMLQRDLNFSRVSVKNPFIRPPTSFPPDPTLFTLRRLYPEMSVKAFGLSFSLTLPSLCRHE